METLRRMKISTARFILLPRGNMNVAVLPCRLFSYQATKEKRRNKGNCPRRERIQAAGILIFARLKRANAGRTSFSHHSKPRRHSCSPRRISGINARRCGANQTKTDVVVEVIGFVPVAVRTAGVVSIVVPRTAAQHAGLLLNEPFITFIPQVNCGMNDHDAFFHPPSSLPISATIAEA